MQSCVHSFFFFARPTDPPSREGGRWETKHFMGWPFRELMSQFSSSNHNSTLTFVELTHVGFAWGSWLHGRQFLNERDKFLNWKE